MVKSGLWYVFFLLIFAGALLPITHATEKSISSELMTEDIEVLSESFEKVYSSAGLFAFNPIFLVPCHLFPEIIPLRSQLNQSTELKPPRI